MRQEPQIQQWQVVPLLKGMRRRIENSERLATLLAWVAGSYLAFCDRTIRWQVEGQDALEAALREGPVLLIMWHERSIMGALHWPVKAGPLSSLYANSPIGRVSGALQRRVGLQAMRMHDGASNLAASRQVLKRVREGVSIGLTGDGPLGPALVLKDAPLDWARVTGMPVFTYAFATNRARRLESWDRMVLPKPFGRGGKVFVRFDRAIPRTLDAPALEVLRADMAEALTSAMARADALVAR